MSENTFMKLYREATLPQNGTLYGGSYPASSEADVMEAFMAYAEASAGMEKDGMLYAEAAQDLVDVRGFSMVGAIMYAEAEGGFFKKILNAIINLYEKAKDFIIKLLGRFKSNKTYRTDLIYIKEVFTKVAGLTSLNENDSFKYKEIQYKAIAALIMGTIGNKSGEKEKALFSHKFAEETVDNGKVSVDVDSLYAAVEKVVKTKGDNATVENANDVEKLFKAINASNDTRDADKILKTFYRVALAAEEVGKAKLASNDPMKPAECVAKLWEGNEEVAKGITEIQDACKTISEAVAKIVYNDIEEALDKGIKEYKKKVDELKSMVNKMSDNWNTVNSDADSSTDQKTIAPKLMNIATQYSKFMTDLSTAVVTAFNTGKIQLDKFIAYTKGMASSLDKLKNVTTSQKSEPAKPKDPDENTQTA